MPKSLQRTYTCSFYFWMDLLGILSVPLDHSLVRAAQLWNKLTGKKRSLRLDIQLCQLTLGNPWKLLGVLHCHRTDFRCLSHHFLLVNKVKLSPNSSIDVCIHGSPVDEAHDGFSNSPMVAEGQGECWCLDPNSQVNSYFTQFVAINPDVLLVDTLVNHQISPDSWWNPVAIPSISLPNELKGETMVGNSWKFLKGAIKSHWFPAFRWLFQIFFSKSHRIPIEIP